MHSSVCKIVYSRPDLESEAAESVWLEVQTCKSSILVGYIYRNPAAIFDWYGLFVTMMDKTVNGILFNWMALLLTFKKQTNQSSVGFHNIFIWP